MKVTYLNQLKVDSSGYDLPSFLYGESIFTSSCILQGKIPFWEDHKARLVEGVKSFFFIDDVNDIEILNARLSKISELTQSVQDGYVRITIFPNHFITLSQMITTVNELDILIQISEQQNILSSKKCCTLDLGNLRFPSHIKSGSYANPIYWKRFVGKQGFDDYIRLNESSVLEASTSNIFLYKGENVFLTPKIEQGVLSGITRAKLIEYLRNQNYECREQEIDCSLLEQAQEIFLTNAVQGISPVAQLDGRPYNIEMAKMLHLEWPWEDS